MSILENTTVIVFDIETTGLNQLFDTVIEFGAVKVFGGRVVEEKSMMFKGGICSPYLVKNVHKIKDYMREDCPYFEEGAREVFDFLNNNIVITHNGKQFDVPFLNAKGAKLGLSLNVRLIDTIVLARKLDFKSNSLQFLCEHYNIKYGSHRGLGDALSTYELVDKLAKDLKITRLDEIII